MNQYILDTEFAVQSLFELVTEELNKIASLEVQLISHRDRANSILSEAYYVTDQDVDDLETPGMYAIRHGYPRHVSAAQAVQKEISNLEASYYAKDSSIRTLYGSILQIAKQGISIVHGKKMPIVIIETKSSETFHNIIRQGRNQSMHYEEGNYHPRLISCFNNLERAFGSDFDLNTGDNKAKFVVIDVLEWRNYSDYLSTMKRLLP